MATRPAQPRDAATTKTEGGDVQLQYSLAPAAPAGLTFDLLPSDYRQRQYGRQQLRQLAMFAASSLALAIFSGTGIRWRAANYKPQLQALREQVSFLENNRDRVPALLTQGEQLLATSTVIVAVRRQQLWDEIFTEVAAVVPAQARLLQLQLARRDANADSSEYELLIRGETHSPEAIILITTALLKCPHIQAASLQQAGESTSANAQAVRFEIKATAGPSRL